MLHGYKVFVTGQGTFLEDHMTVDSASFYKGDNVPRGAALEVLQQSSDELV